MTAYNILVKASLAEILAKDPDVSIKSELIFSLRVIDVMLKMEKEFFKSDTLETPRSLIHDCLTIEEPDVIYLKLTCCRNMLDKFNNYMHSYL